MKGLDVKYPSSWIVCSASAEDGVFMIRKLWAIFLCIYFIFPTWRIDRMFYIYIFKWFYFFSSTVNSYAHITLILPGLFRCYAVSLFILIWYIISNISNWTGFLESVREPRYGALDKLYTGTKLCNHVSHHTCSFCVCRLVIINGLLCSKKIEFNILGGNKMRQK